MGIFGRYEAEEVTILDGVTRRCAPHWFPRSPPVFDLDWANASATCMVCERCGYVHWFLPA